MRHLLCLLPCALLACGGPTVPMKVDVSGTFNGDPVSFKSAQLADSSFRVTSLHLGAMADGSCGGLDFTLRVASRDSDVRAPGTFSLSTTQDYDHAWPDEGFRVDVEDNRNGCSSDQPLIQGVAGTITFDSISYWGATGSLDVTLPSGGSLKGTFSAPRVDIDFQ